MNDHIGYGVFATRLIPRGTITWVRDELDQTFQVEQVAAMPAPYREILDRYAFVDAQGMLVLCWDHSRFFNHSCEANCLSAGYDFEVAVRDIQSGDELTDDYGTLNLREPFVCGCRLATCRGKVRPDDMERLSPVWDQEMRSVFPLIPRVTQPLWGFLRERVAVEEALREPSRLRSIRCNYVPPRAC